MSINKSIFECHAPIPIDTSCVEEVGEEVDILGPELVLGLHVGVGEVSLLDLKANIAIF